MRARRILSSAFFVFFWASFAGQQSLESGAKTKMSTSTGPRPLKRPASGFRRGEANDRDLAGGCQPLSSTFLQPSVLFEQDPPTFDPPGHGKQAPEGLWVGDMLLG